MNKKKHTNMKDTINKKSRVRKEKISRCNNSKVLLAVEFVPHFFCGEKKTNKLNAVVDGVQFFLEEHLHTSTLACRC